MSLVWLCCYTNLRPETRAALLEHAAPDRIRFVDVQHSETAYAEELRDAWMHGNADLAVVEHDNIVRPDIVDTFRNCPEPYCAYGYDWTTNRAPALGMTRFRRSFMVEHVDAIRWAVTQPSAWGRPGHWKQVGWFLTEGYLYHRLGVRPHTHLPSCAHLNEAQVLRPDVAGLSDVEHLALLGLEPAT